MSISASNQSGKALLVPSANADSNAIANSSGNGSSKSDKNLQKVNRLSRSNSVMAVEDDPFKKAVDEFRSNGHTLHVENIAEAVAITEDDFEALLLQPIKAIEKNDERIEKLAELKVPYLFTSKQLMTLCLLQTSQKTQMRMIEQLSQRLMDPKSMTSELMGLFRSNMEKEKVDFLLKQRFDVMHKTRTGLIGGIGGSALLLSSRGGAGRGSGNSNNSSSKRARSRSLGVTPSSSMGDLAEINSNYRKEMDSTRAATTTVARTSIAAAFEQVQFSSGNMGSEEMVPTASRADILRTDSGVPVRSPSGSALVQLNTAAATDPPSSSPSLSSSSSPSCISPSFSPSLSPMLTPNAASAKVRRKVSFFSEIAEVDEPVDESVVTEVDEPAAAVTVETANDTTTATTSTPTAATTSASTTAAATTDVAASGGVTTDASTITANGTKDTEDVSAAVSIGKRSSTAAAATTAKTDSAVTAPAAIVTNSTNTKPTTSNGNNTSSSRTNVASGNSSNSITNNSSSDSNSSRGGSWLSMFSCCTGSGAIASVPSEQ